jgi:hypothetical protein
VANLPETDALAIGRWFGFEFNSVDVGKSQELKDGRWHQRVTKRPFEGQRQSPAKRSSKLRGNAMSILTVSITVPLPSAIEKLRTPISRWSRMAAANTAAPRRAAPR